MPVRGLSPQANHLLWIRIRKRTEQHSINDRKNCRGCPEAESQCEDGHRRETGVFAKHPEAETQILPQCLDTRLPARQAHDFFSHFEVAPLQSYRAKGIGAAHTMFHFFLDRHLQEAIQFLIQFLANLLLSKQRPEPISYVW